MVLQSKSKVYFFTDKLSLNLKHRNKLKEFITSIFKREKKKLGGLNYIFCSNRRIIEINRKYLNHDFYTDVITFDLSENNAEIFGEIYISIEMVRQNAQKLGVSFTNELHRVIFHGALHLCGFKDHKSRDKETMRKMENKYLAQYYTKVPRNTVSD